MKGQYFSFDAIIASVIFVLALVALLSYWHSVKSFLDYQNDQLSRDAIRISNLLLTPPEPSSDCDTMTRLGLAMSWSDRRADVDIIDCAQTQSQEWLKNVTSSSYNLSITMTNLADSSEMTIGGDVPLDASDVVKIRRLTTVHNSTDNSNYLAALDISLYK